MPYNTLVTSVRNNIEALANGWQEEAQSSPYMNTYHSLETDDLHKRGKVLFTNLLKWLESGASNKEVEGYFENVGKTRLDEGFPLSEVNHAVYLTKKVFLSYISNHYELIGNMDSKEAFEFCTLLNSYFDLGDFHIIRGYLKELFEHLDGTKKFTKEELENYFKRGALHKEAEKEVDEYNMYYDMIHMGFFPKM
ncbi:MAG: RsbRD N-terminal domain-containing protein [Pseudomonadota bacterium]